VTAADILTDFVLAKTRF